MINKLALLAASLIASLTLAVALAASGFAPGSTPASTAVTTMTSVADAIPTEPPVQVDTVYVKPPPKRQTITVHKVVASIGGEPGEGPEGGD